GSYCASWADISRGTAGGLEPRCGIGPRKADMFAHGRLRRIAVATPQCGQDLLMLLVGLARAPRRGAAAEAIDAREAVHIFTQQPKQPPIVAAAGNPEMEILIAAGLVVGGAACHIRLPAMRRQALFERIQILVGHGH